MKHQKKYRFTAMAFLAIYLLSVFSVFAKHGHTSGLHFKEYHFKGGKAAVSKSANISNNTDCSICHLQQSVYTYILPKKFSVKEFSEYYYSAKKFQVPDCYTSVAVHSFFLRGPPDRLFI